MHIRKVIANIVCGLIPSKKYRHKIRSYLKGRIGKNNRVIVIKDGKEYVNHWFKIPRGLKISTIGNNNIIKLHLPMHFKKASINLECDNGIVEILEGCYLLEFNINFAKCNAPKCRIGKSVSTEGVTIFTRASSQIVIEDECMFSHSILIRLSDSHRIYDKKGKDIINKQKWPLKIGRHSWIGQNVFISKNAIIPPNSIIGMASVVSSQFTEEYTCIAGNPAKVVKKGVIWTRELES